ncbi:acyl-CoA dehydrogenase family protein [Nocardia sp. alder85J]|uniref:acyl-CoA dehydrogenase family protein n=1 Tax=Nocardia sp. alder85J TaxID=2862949 RepID=UPI001CD1B453|nr:acyl-CoA dehydrogenase family protein [Nocardia sp. alder85J]MCX4096784.1 acyl-CoA/acyl-ACP dehydrogenase [Nocardia sp. alder85J]
MDRYELRRLDYSLSEDQTEVQAVYAKFFATRSPIDVVRAAEPTGFDRNLWDQLCATGATSMALPESVGGDGATLVDLVLVAEELGRTSAPVPWIEHVCATRLLARLGALTDAPDLVSGRRIATVDACLDVAAGPRLIPAAAVADEIVARHGGDIVWLTPDTRPDPVANLGRLPLAWIDPAAGARVVASGDAAAAHYATALDEWRLLTAAALVGLVDETTRIAAEFATTRYTLGVPISTLQGISHPLANNAIVVRSGRALSRRAAWFLEFEPGVRDELASAAFVFMAEEAARAATVAVHIQGGLGVAAESAASGHLVRARGWPLAGGDPAASARRAAILLAGHVSGSSRPAPV